MFAGCRALAGALVILVAAPQPQRFDPLRASLARDAPQAIYASDPADPWNQVFHLLFTRSVAARLMAEGAVPFASGDNRLVLSDRRVTRIESGDRAIDPLYPSWLWMGSADFDFEKGEPWRILDEPRYSRLQDAVDGVRRSAGSHSPLARALMQADLWSAFDQLHVLSRVRASARDQAMADRAGRAARLLPGLAAAIRTLALTKGEIAQLPDTYRLAAKTLNLPALLDPQSGWMEIRWFPGRSHDGSAGHRRASRVFLKPLNHPRDEAAFLNWLRDGSADALGRLESVALLTQLQLVASDGTVVPSPLAFEIQFRGAAVRTARGEIPQYELNRRLLLDAPASGGIVGFDAAAPAYLPLAGNDLSFATPTRLDGEAVLAPLGARCATCHGSREGVGHLMTFSRITVPGRPIPRVERLATADNVHGRAVAVLKMEAEDFKALRRLWQ